MFVAIARSAASRGSSGTIPSPSSRITSAGARRTRRRSIFTRRAFASREFWTSSATALRGSLWLRASHRMRSNGSAGLSLSVDLEEEGIGRSIGAPHPRRPSYDRSAFPIALDARLILWTMGRSAMMVTEFDRHYQALPRRRRRSEDAGSGRAAGVRRRDHRRVRDSGEVVPGCRPEPEAETALHEVHVPADGRAAPLLSDNGFTNYIVSGGGRDFMRVVAEACYGVAPEHVIGSAPGFQ